MKVTHAEHKVGTAVGEGDHWIGKYVGKDPDLRGHHAMVKRPGAHSPAVNAVAVQFTDRQTGFGYGWWWWFNDHDFERVG